MIDNSCKINAIHNEIAQCDEYLQSLQYQFDRNREMYIEGYGSDKELCKYNNNKILKEMDKTSKKKDKLIQKLNKLGM